MTRVQALLEDGRSLTWLFYGDSITPVALHTVGWRDYTELFAERIRFEMGRVNDAIINTGIAPSPGAAFKHLVWLIRAVRSEN